MNEPVTQLQILNGSESKRIFALNQIIAAKENNILRIGWQDKAKEISQTILEFKKNLQNLFHQHMRPWNMKERIGISAMGNG